MEAAVEKSRINRHKVVSPAVWLAARKRYLLREKEFTRLRDELSRERRELPWVKLEKEYVFDTAHGNRRSPICSTVAAS